MKFSFLKNTVTPVVPYNDHALRIVLCLVAAHIMVLYNDHQSFFEAVVTKSYLRGFAASFIMAYIVTGYIYRVTIHLDKKYDWQQQTLPRFFWQCCMGFIVPALLVFSLVGVFLALYHINILETAYLRQDYPLTLLMLLSFNLYYFGFYCYLKLSHYRDVQKLTLPSGYQVRESSTGDYPLELENTQHEVPQEKKQFKEILMIDTPLQTLPVATYDIAYAYLLSGTTFLHLKGMQHLSESYPTNYSLKDLENLLDPSTFFRINRQMIINRSCIRSFGAETSKTLLLNIQPEPYPIKKDTAQEHQKLLVVSESRTPRFKIWMNR